MFKLTIQLGSVYFSKELCGGLCYISDHPVILDTHIPQLSNNNTVFSEYSVLIGNFRVRVQKGCSLKGVETEGSSIVRFLFASLSLDVY